MAVSPKVSVIVPVYNCEKYLSRCINSLGNQTLDGIEILLVNDGSTDDSLKICRSYASQYQNIVVLDQVNGGAAKARVEGLKVSTGEYISFVDSDDWVDGRMLEILYEKACQINADIFQCGFIPTDGSCEQNNDHGDSQVVSVYPARNAILQLFGCMHGSQFSFTLWGKLFHRRLFEHITFPVHPHMINDVPVVARVFGEAKTAAAIDGKLYYYFDRGDSNNQSTMDQLYSERSKFIQSHLEAFNDVSNYYKERDHELYLASLKHAVSWALSALIRRNISKDCKTLAKEIIKYAQIRGNPFLPWKKKITALIIQDICR